MVGLHFIPSYVESCVVSVLVSANAATVRFKPVRICFRARGSGSVLAEFEPVLRAWARARLVAQLPTGCRARTSAARAVQYGKGRSDKGYGEDAGAMAAPLVHGRPWSAELFSSSASVLRDRR